MTTFLVLYRWTDVPEEEMEILTLEQGRAAIETRRRWAEQAGSAVVDPGSSLGTARRFTAGAGLSLVDPEFSGYSILQATDADALRALLDSHPFHGEPGVVIDALEIVPIPGILQARDG